MDAEHREAYLLLVRVLILVYGFTPCTSATPPLRRRLCTVSNHSKPPLATNLLDFPGVLQSYQEAYLVLHRAAKLLNLPDMVIWGDVVGSLTSVLLWWL